MENSPFTPDIESDIIREDGTNLDFYDELVSISTAPKHKELFLIVQGGGEINQGSEDAGKFYCERSELEALFKEFCAFVGTDATGMNIGDALYLLEAQGGIYIHGDLVFLQPKFGGGIGSSYRSQIDQR
jgi:hypothetical protein